MSTTDVITAVLYYTLGAIGLLAGLLVFVIGPIQEWRYQRWLDRNS